MGLLGSTALVAASLAVSPAFAQVAVGGGTITYTNGTAASNTPGASDGVSIAGSNANQSTINSVSVFNTTGVPTADAVRLTNTSGVVLTGANSLRTSVSGGSGLYVQSNVNLGLNLTGGANTLQGSYGIRALAASGFINFNSTGQTQTITGNGTALIGIDVQALLHPEVYFGTSVVSGFATGVQLTQSQTSGGYVYFTSTGGSINATGTGIRADAVNGAANVESGTAIVAPTGINATGGSITVTTSGGGAINSTVAGTGTGILASTTGGDATINVGAAIGNVTAVNVGVNAYAMGAGALNFTTSAAINASGNSSRGIFANTDGGAITIVSGGTITAQDTGLYLNAGGTGVVNVTVNAAINAFGSGGVGVSSFNALGSVFDVNANITGGNRAMGVRGTVNVASGVVLTGNFFGIDLSGGGTLNNAGAINSNYRTVAILGGTINNLATGAITSSGTAAANGAAVYGSGTLNNAGAITGNTTDGVFFQSASGTVNNDAGGTITGVRGVFANTTGNVTITNTAGAISGSTDAVHMLGGGRLTLVNTGTIQTVGGTGGAGAGGVYINSSNGTAHSVTNSGTINGGSAATFGYGVSIDAGALTLVNQSGGVIGGGLGGIRLSTADAATLTLAQGSTVNGQIFSDDIGAVTATIAGLLDGDYNASGGSGVDTITLASTGSITGNVVLGGGADTFNWNGGTISGTLDGGSDYGNTLAVALGAGVSRTLNGGGAFFSTKTLTSGNLSLTGNVDSATTWQVSGANSQLIFDGIFGSGATLATANSNGTITIATGRTYSGTNIVINSGTLNNNGTMTGGGYSGNPATFYTHAVNFNGTGTVNNTGVMQTGAFDYTAPIFSRFGALITVNNSGRIAGDIAGTASITDGIRDHGGSLIVNNQTATSIIRGSQSGIVTTGSGGVTLTNAGVVTGGVNAVNSAGSATITNLSGGVIGTGTVDDAGAFSAGGTGHAINLASGGTINNSGTIRGAGAGVFASAGTLNLTNESGGTVSGGTASVQVSTTGTATLDLQAGSTTTGDVILTGTGARTVTIAGAFNGYLNAAGNSGAVNLNLNTSATGYTLLEGGSGADTLTFAGSGSRTFSVDNLTSWNTGAFTGGAWTLTGTGNATSFVSGLALSGGSSVSISDTLQLQGATGLSMTGGASIVTTASLSNTRTISLLGAGGLAVSSGRTLTQSGVISGGGQLSLIGPGTTILSGNNTYTGGTIVNSGILRLGHTSGAGTGVIRMIDPQIDFAAAGTYNNDISLEVVNGQQAADPTILNNTAGGAVTLAGRIYETGGVGGANQYVTVNGGTISLTNNTNSWGGVTTVNSLANLVGTTGSISGGSIVNNGAMTYRNTSAGTASQAISGSGLINVDGTAAATLNGAITTTGQLSINGANASLIIGGSRSGANNSAIQLIASGASLSVANGGSILGGQYLGVRISTVGTTVINLGLIQNAGTGADGTIGAGLFVQTTGGVTTVNNGSITDTGAGSTIQGRNAGVRHEAGSTDLLVVNNYGLIVGDLYNGVENTGGGLTVNNFAGGYIATTLGNGVSSASATGVSVTNAGVIGRNIAGDVTVNGYGVVASGALTLVNQAGGTITGLTGGVSAGAGGSVTNLAGGQILGAEGVAFANGATGTLTNAGVITGSSAFAVHISGAGTITNQSGGTISGSAGSLQLAGTGAKTIDLLAGSTTTGQIFSTATGTQTVTIAGTLNGAYTSASGAGVDNLTLAASGSMTSADLGGGADSFTYQGGSFSGLIDGGTGTDSFISALGAGAASLSLNLLGNFETFTHQSGTLTLTGVGIATGGVAVQGGTLIMDGILPYAVGVASGGTLGGGGRVGAVSIANGGVLANTQGSTLTMGSLDLLSGSTINATFSGAGGPALFAVTGDVVLDGTVNVASTGAYGFGVYGLMTYGGLLTNNGLVVGATPAGAQRVLVQTSVAGQVNIVHAPTELLFWDGGNGAQHDNGAVNGGAGVWTAAGTNWTDSSGLSNGAMEPQPGFAIFQGTGGLVTVDAVAGAVAVTGMQFAADGYRIQGDSIGLASASTTIRVGNGTAPGAGWTATIASALTGTGGLLKTDLGKLILAGDSNFTGGTIINAGTLQIGEGGAAGSVAGSLVLANNSALVFSRSDNHNFANDISGTGTVSLNGVASLSGAITASNGVNVGAGSTATLSNVSVATGTAVTAGLNSTVNVASGGTVSNANGVGIHFTGSGSLTNSGLITGTNFGVVLNGGGTLSNLSGGEIRGVTGVLANALTSVSNASGATIAATTGNAVRLVASGSSVANAGVIRAASIFSGVYFDQSGTVTNQAGGSISNTATAVQFFGANSVLDNAGSISNTNTNSAVYFNNSGVVTNRATGTVDSVNGYGVQLAGANSSVVNLGSITAGQRGVSLDGANSTLTNSGSISGGNAAVLAAGGMVVNDGSMTGTAGSALALSNGGVVDNRATGLLRGATNGLNGAAGIAGVTNAGRIEGLNGAGVRLAGGGSVDNLSGGSISGTSAAILSVGSFVDSITLRDGSALTGGLSLAGGDDTLFMHGGAATSGLIDGGDDFDAFVVAGAGSSSFDIGNLVNFESRTMNGAGTFTLTGVDASTVAWAINSGTLAVSGGAAINDSAAVTIAAPGALKLDASERIGSLSGAGSVALGSSTLTVGGAGASTYAGVIGGSGGVVVTGGGALTLSGANTYTGATTASGATLRLGASNVLSDASSLTAQFAGVIDMGAFNDTVDNVTFFTGTRLDGTGTLTAASYTSWGATLNANLGTGTLNAIGGVTTLNGTVGAGQVVVNGGSVMLGASDRLSDTANVSVASGNQLNLGAFNDTIGALSLSGSLQGSGTLTAGQYALNGGVVNANLGAGFLTSQGVSTLNGTAGAASAVVTGGALTLGASNRLSDAAVVSVSTGATLNLQGFNDTITTLDLNGRLAGTGTLTANTYFVRTGSVVDANLGAGQVRVNGDTLLNGTAAAASVVINSGTLTLGSANRLADGATVSVASGSALNIGTFNDTVALALLNGTLTGTGTLTAGEYDLNGATINANLGAGALFNVGGASTLNGTSAAANVIVQGGTLSLGASNRLADTATVSVSSGAILNLSAFNDTVGLAVVNGTLNGTGTLTAAQYQLNAATVNANLGAGTLFNLGGVSTLNGAAAASQVSVNAGTLRLGANERLSDAATVSVASGATFNVNGFNERVGALFGTGSVDVGAGRLTFGGAESGFGGRLSGSGSVVHTGGLFTLTGDHTIASISNTGGELRFVGTTTGGIAASGGSVTGAGTIGGALTASNGAILSPGLAGVQNGIGGFTAGGLTLNGGTLAIDVLGKSGGNLVDQLRINGAATLTGGLLAPTFQGATSNFDFSTRYLFLQANTLVGAFANGANFTAAAQEGLFWRVRYDLSPNAAVLELRQLTNFDPGATGTDNQRGVGQALSGGQLGASDDWAAILSLIAGLNAADRAAAFDSISGEPLSDVTTSLFSANDSFLNALRDGGLGGRKDGGEAMNFVDNLSFIGGKETSADRLGDVLGAFDPSASTDRGAGGWVSAYAGDQTLDGKPGQATVESKLNGFAGGYGSRVGAMSIGAAGGVTRLEGDVAARQGHYESDLAHAAGYVAYDDGVWAADLTASFYGGDLDTRRGITVGAFHGQAIGNTHVEGQALSASVARRFQVSDNTMIALGAIGTASNASVDGYTETGAGGLSLTASGQERDWQSLQLSARGTQDYRVNGQGFRIYGGAGVMAIAGDRQATGDMRFSGAPIGFGSFTVEGAEAPPLAGLADFGVEIGAGDGVTVSAGYRGLFSERLRDNQIGVKLQINW